MKPPLKLKVLRQPPALLMEVIIACVIIALVIFPLIEPHVMIFRSQKEFVHEINLDHAVNLLFVDIMQQLYENRIPFEEIEGGKKFPVMTEIWKALGVDSIPPFKGSYFFKESKHKPKNKDPVTAYLFQLNLTFEQIGGDPKKNKPFKYKYDVVILRKLKAGKETPQGQMLPI